MHTHRINHLIVSLLSGLALATALLLLISMLPPVAQATQSTSGVSLPFSSQLELPGGWRGAALVENSSVLTFSPVITVYLPVVQRAGPCGAAPALFTPASGSLLDTLIPTFTYFRGSAVVSYTELDFATNSAISPTTTSYTTYGTGPGPYQLQVFDNFEPATTYYWRGEDVCGAFTGPSSPVYSFTTGSGGTILPAPTLQTPVSGTVGLGQQVTLKWNSVPGASGYQVLVGNAGPTTCSGGGILYFTTGNSQIVTVEPNTTWLWCVTAQNHYAYGGASNPWLFSTGSFASRQPAVSEAPWDGMHSLLRIANGWIRHPAQTGKP